MLHMDLFKNINQNLNLLRKRRFMKAQDLQFTQLIQGAKQFIIPIFQRNYSWDGGHCEQLWSDIIRVGSNSKLESHL